MKRTSIHRADSRLLGVVVGVVVIAALYFARVVFIPLALALLFSVVLTPPVTFLERIKLPRVLAIVLLVVVSVGTIGLVGWKTSQQFVDLTNQLPSYKKTLQEKIQSVRGPSSQSLTRASDTVKELSKEIGALTPGSPAPASETRKTPAPPGSPPSRPLAVEVVPPINPFESMQNLLGPLGTAGMVILFTIFILLDHEDLRNRLIRFAGGSRLNSMTQALDEATLRINRYLFLQLLVNAGYGLLVFMALHVIDIPNAALWGVCAAVLRFLPYVGAPLAALMPIILSLAVFSGWGHALETAALFVGLEAIVANFVEPILYGAHVGLAPLAILVAAIFWTMIWGFAGLVLSTPLTVCLVVMGRHLPSLAFLNVLLGDEPVLSPSAHFYQRLLAGDQNEAKQVVEEYLKEKSVEEAYDSVVIPALILAEHDRHRNLLEQETQDFIFQSAREIIEELAETESEPATESTARTPASLSSSEFDDSGVPEVLCIPARDEADDVVGMLLAQLIQRNGQRALSIPMGPTADMLSQVADLNPAAVCISALPPFAIEHARALYGKLRSQFPKLHIVICLWHFEGDARKASNRLKLSNGHGFFTTLPPVLEHIAFHAQKNPSGARQL